MLFRSVLTKDSSCAHQETCEKEHELFMIDAENFELVISDTSSRIVRREWRLTGFMGAGYRAQTKWQLFLSQEEVERLNGVLAGL